MYDAEDTIVAPATPSGESALAIVRVSGGAVRALSDSIPSAGCPEARKAVYGAFRAVDGHTIDYCVFVRFEKGASYTGEDMLEVSCHGNPIIVRQIVDDLLTRGCRSAEPGEFTRRAFLNGRMDLTQAEAVQEIISARSEAALEAARRQLDGSVGRAVNALLDRLLEVIAHLEAYIDFPEEDLPVEDEAGPIMQLAKLQEDAKSLMATAPYSSMLHDGFLTVIAGAPNAGKSSLMNALLGRDRAIVSEEPGTTRDYLEERLVIDRHLVRIVDTAGLREIEKGVEKLGIDKSIEQIQKAELVLYVVDASSKTPPPPFRSNLAHKGAEILVVENKSDLGCAGWEFMPGSKRVRTSAITGDGLSELRKAIAAVIGERAPVHSRDDVIVSARHAAALGNMSNSIAAAIDRLRSGEPTELAACELREALACLEEIVGRIDNERVLDRIFSSFCIGK
ncbi:MAG TPA: tRNA uridine-5-carboxymethylaminomethyl(34) synthesis GTPase MnmE [Opitutales bacterium]|nr:tRNA uridine-5-carboxymethylaminomethyl(34) synthesis GTPase MnmE [Opitutales bacterium]